MGAEINKLSDKKLKALLGNEREKPMKLSDGAGLMVRVTVKGAVSWLFKYRLGGRDSLAQVLTLGRYPDMSLKQAREKRDQCRSWLSESKDPRHQLNITEAETLRPVTVRDALSYWIKEYATDNRANVDKHISQLNKHIYPYIGAMPLLQCETRHWLECFDRMKKTSPVAAGYVFQMCKQALKFCRVRRYAISNVLDDLTINDVGKKQNKGDRVHDDNELGQIWRSIDELRFKPYYAYFLRLLVVFGCRSQEVRLSSWQEWDLKKWLWTVPKEHSKGGVKIVRPIPDAIRPFIQSLHDKHEKTGLLLGEIKESSAVSAWGRLIWKRLGHSEEWTLHDLRRSFSTKLSDLGTPPHIVEQLLGHAMPSIMSVYNHSQYLPEKLESLNQWCDRLDLLSSNHENVILLRINK